MWRDTVGEGVPVTMSLCFRKKVSENEFCNAVLLYTLEQGERGERERER